MSRNPKPTILRVLVLCFHDMLTYAMLSPVLALLFLDSTCCLLKTDNQMKHFIFGLFLSVYSLMQICSLPFWAKASLRISKKSILKLSYLGNCLGYCLGAAGVYYEAVPLLFVGSALAGLMGANLPTMQALISENAPRTQWARHYSLLGAIIGAAFILGPQITGLCLHHLSNRSVCLAMYLICSGVSAFNCLLIRFIPDPPSAPVLPSQPAPAATLYFQPPAFFSFSRDLQKILLFQFCICMGWYCFIKFFQVYLMETLRCSHVWSCYGISYLGLCCTVWQGIRFSLNARIFAFKYSFHVGLVLMAGSFLGFMLIDSIPGVVIAVCCLACSYAMLVPSILALLIGKDGARAEYKTSAYQSVQAMAKILAPLLAGFVLSFTSLGTALICIILVALAGLVLLRSPASFQADYQA